MKTFRLFSMAALALMMAACSNEDNDLTLQDGKLPFSATIAAPGSGASTRTTYTEVTSGDDAGKINVAWKEGDEIALVHGGVKDVVTVGTPNADGSAPITGAITVGTDDEDVVLVYPADLVASVTSGTTYTEDASVTGKFMTQDGTLAYIQDNLDIRKGTGKLAVSGASASLKANVSMASQIAIWKLTLKDGGNLLSAKNATVKVGGNSVAYASTSPKFTNSIVYFALAPVTNSDGALRIDATHQYGDPFKYEAASGISLSAGTYYQSTVSMVMDH